MRLSELAAAGNPAVKDDVQRCCVRAPGVHVLPPRRGLRPRYGLDLGVSL